jgi:hypothetical protein
MLPSENVDGDDGFQANYCRRPADDDRDPLGNVLPGATWVPCGTPFTFFRQLTCGLDWRPCNGPDSEFLIVLGGGFEGFP